MQSSPKTKELASLADRSDDEYEPVPVDAALVLAEVELEILELQEQELLAHGLLHVAGAEAAHLLETGHRLRFGCCRAL